jgi:F-type H+-transporting ATPase subunit gamma
MSKVVELRSKIKSISRINKMTEAMQVVAVAQLKLMQARQRAAMHYKRHYDRLAKRLNVSVRREIKKTEPVTLCYLFASERGFCGNFNEKIFSLAKTSIDSEEAAERQVRFIIIGRKGLECPLKEEQILNKVIGVEKFTFEQVSSYAMDALTLFKENKVKKVCLIYNQFISMLDQSSFFLRVLPFDLSGITVSPAEILFEPSHRVVAEHVELSYLKALFYDAFMQTRMGEVASRLMTMRSSAQNSKEIINDLNIKLNKARQASITVELAEILSSFEILQGES